MPALSIVIPTRNRYESLLPVIEALRGKILGDDYEIVVQDNTPDNALARRYFAHLNDPRVKYHHTPERLSQSGNSDVALSRAAGDYVLFIGDDDFVTPYILRIVEMMRRRKIECLTYITASYCWSNLEIKRESKWNRAGSFYISGSVSGRATIRPVAQALREMLAAGAITIYPLPKVYHGIVSRKVLSRMREANGGRYVIGSCPDMNLAVSLAANISEYCFLEYPVSANGAAPKSGSGLTANKAHRATLEAMVADGWLPREVIEGWNPSIARVWTMPTIYAQAAWEGLLANGMPDGINYARHYADCYWRERWARRQVNQAVRHAIKEKKTTRGAVAEACAVVFAKRLLAPVLKPVIGKMIGKPLPRRYEKVRSVGECMDILLQIPFEDDSQ